MTWLEVVLTLLAVYRVTILATQDTITKPGRDWLDRHFTGSLVELVNCPWCMSMWLGGGAAAVDYFWWGSVWLPWLWLALAASGVTGFLAERS